MWIEYRYIDIYMSEVRCKHKSIFFDGFVTVNFQEDAFEEAILFQFVYLSRFLFMASIFLLWLEQNKIVNVVGSMFGYIRYC